MGWFLFGGVLGLAVCWLLACASKLLLLGLLVPIFTVYHLIRMFLESH